MFNPRYSVKPVFLLAVMLSVLVGCGLPEAPPMNRLASQVLLDERYLREVFVRAVDDPEASAKLEASIKQLDRELIEFRAFMKDVELGKIKVRFDKYMCFSELRQKDNYIRADYSWKKGPVTQYDKRGRADPFPLIYGLRFYPNGYLKDAHTIQAGLAFDEQGKAASFWYHTATGSRDVRLGEDGKVQYHLWPFRRYRVDVSQQKKP